MSRFLLASVFPLFCLQCGCFAVEIGYKFTGTVFFGSSPFGIPIEEDTHVVGRFIYDIAAQPTHHFPGCGDCTGYRQLIVDGLTAGFGDVTVRADDFVATVSNNIQGVAPDSYQDVFDATFDSSFDPPPSSPLVMEGVNRVGGVFGVSLTADSSLLADSSLVASLNYSEFEYGSGILGDADGNQAFFSIDSLAGFPVIRGDYNMDGSVDDSDYAYWKTTYGSALDLAADGNRNRSVDAADYTVWRDHLGAGDSHGMTSASNTVPEPSAVWLLLIGVILSFAANHLMLCGHLGRGQI
jgi:hypothetical protein